MRVVTGFGRSHTKHLFIPFIIWDIYLISILSLCVLVCNFTCTMCHILRLVFPIEYLNTCTLCRISSLNIVSICICHLIQIHSSQSVHPFRCSESPLLFFWNFHQIFWALSHPGQLSLPSKIRDQVLKRAQPINWGQAPTLLLDIDILFPESL